MLAHPRQTRYNPSRIHPPHRGISSVGRAVASHATGQGFESPMLHAKRHPKWVPFCMEQFRVLSPSALLRAVHELPGLPGARRARAVVEHTRKPGGLPRPERRGHLRAGTSATPRASGAVRSLNGRVATPHFGCLFAWSITGLLTLLRCSKYAMGSHAAAQAKLPTAVRQLGQTRSVCPAGSSRRGVADGAAASQ